MNSITGRKKMNEKKEEGRGRVVEKSLKERHCRSVNSDSREPIGTETDNKFTYILPMNIHISIYNECMCVYMHNISRLKNVAFIRNLLFEYRGKDEECG